MFPKHMLRVDAIEKVCKLHILTAEFFLLGHIRFCYPTILLKIQQNWHIFTFNVHYFHHKLVLSIRYVEKVPKLFQKITMQKITEANWKEHNKSNFWRGLLCIFSVFSKSIKAGDSEAISQFKCQSRDQTLITRTIYAIICYMLGVRSPPKIIVLYRGPFLGQNKVYF